MGKYKTAITLTGYGCGRLIKGSKQAKAHMAYLRSLRKKYGGKIGRGKAKLNKYQGNGFNPFGLIGKSLKYWVNYGKSWKDDKDADNKEIERLKRLKASKGGKFELRDLRDGFMGPIGWIRMGLRKKRQREIERLKKDVGEL